MKTPKTPHEIIMEQLDDMFDTMRLIIGQHNGTPWYLVKNEDVLAYITELRRLKAVQSGRKL